MAAQRSEQILRRLKGLGAQLREGEEPLFSVPAIWENASTRESAACDLVLTNQRLLGFIYTTFPRERLFLDALELPQITQVVLRHKSFEAMFRELLVSAGTQKIYIRATRPKIEATYTALQNALAEHAPVTQTTLAGDTADEPAPDREQPAPTTPTYSRQQVKQPLNRSPLGVTLLLVGGLLLEILGVVAWGVTGSAQTGMPLFLAGIVAVIMATLVRRQMR